jgi:hypothetical protein
MNNLPADGSVCMQDVTYQTGLPDPGRSQKPWDVLAKAWL